MLLVDSIVSTFSFLFIFWIVSVIVISRWIIAYILLMLSMGIVKLGKAIVTLFKPLIRGTNIVASMLMGNE